MQKDLSWRSPEQFGKHWWKVFHEAAAAYPTIPTLTDIHLYSGLFQFFGYYLPCFTCSKDYDNTLNQNHLGEKLYICLIKGKIYVWMWSIDVHNTVNRRLGKPVVSYWDVCESFGILKTELDYALNNPGINFKMDFVPSAYPDLRLDSLTIPHQQQQQQVNEPTTPKLSSKNTNMMSVKNLASPLVGKQNSVKSLNSLTTDPKQHQTVITNNEKKNQIHNNNNFSTSSKIDEKLVKNLLNSNGHVSAAATTSQRKFNTLSDIFPSASNQKQQSSQDYDSQQQQSRRRLSRNSSQRRITNG